MNVTDEFGGAMGTGSHTLEATMTLVMDNRTSVVAEAEAWPAEADLIMSALEVGRGLGAADRRNPNRHSYRTRAVLRLFSDLPETDPWILFVRDIDPRSV